MSKLFIKIKNSIKKIDKYYLFLVLIIIAAFFISFDDLKNPMIAEGDAYSRFNIALNNFIYKKFFQIHIGAWLPIHFSILSLSFFLGENGPRIITFIFNILSIISIYFYSLSLNKNKKSAILTTLLYFLLPLRIILTTQTLTESIFIFFIISSLYFLLKENKNYFLGLLLLLIAQGIRFESWLILPFIFFIIFSDKNTKTIKKINYLTVSISFPLFWIYINNQIYKDPFFFFNHKKGVANQINNIKYFNLKLSFLAWFNKLKQNIQPLFFIFLSVPFFKKKKNNNEIFAILITIYFFLILVLQVYIGSMEWEPHRYLLLPISLSLPVIANQIISISNYLKNKFNKKIKIVFLITITITYFLFSLSQINKLKNQMNWDILVNKKSLEALLNNFPNFYEEGENISYFYDSYQRKWIDQAFFYFLEKQGFSTGDFFGDYYSKDHLIKRNEGILVWEKQTNDKFLKLNKYYDILYENQVFLLMKKKSN